MYASFGHLTGYSSNYYTYAFDKVIALDFFAQFDPKDLLGCDAGCTLPQNRTRAGRIQAGPPDGPRLPRPREEFSAFSEWLNEEFGGEPQAAKS